MAIKKLIGRNIHELNRVSSPLELLFDLTFVVAIAISSAYMHHDISAGHGLITTILVILFFECRKSKQERR